MGAPRAAAVFSYFNRPVARPFFTGENKQMLEHPHPLDDALRQFEKALQLHRLNSSLAEERRRETEDYYKSLFASARRKPIGSKHPPTKENLSVGMIIKPAEKLLRADRMRKLVDRDPRERAVRFDALVRRIRIGTHDQVALAAAELAAFDLGISTPAVRAWRKWEKKAEGVCGWTYRDGGTWCDDDVIHVVIDRPCRDIAITAAHECRHRWQFVNVLGLSREQEEADARGYEVEFGTLFLSQQ
jgi:hypothetical protein